MMIISYRYDEVWSVTKTCMRIYYSDIYSVTPSIVAARSAHRLDAVAVGATSEGSSESSDNASSISRVV